MNKKIKNKIYSLKLQLEECKKWPEIEKEGLLLQANLYKIGKEKAVEVLDWDTGVTKTIHFDGEKDEALARIFKKARRLKRGFALVTQKLAEAETLPELPPKKEIIPLTPRKRLPYKEYTSHSGYKILVGRSKKDNDTLTFKVGQPHDLWLHASDFPGSHVLIRAKRSDEPDAGTIEEAALLAIDASGAKEQKAADVVITRQKYLKRIKGSPGQVLVSQKKVRRFIMDPEKLSAVKQRTVPSHESF